MQARAAAVRQVLLGWYKIPASPADPLELVVNPAGLDERSKVSNAAAGMPLGHGLACMVHCFNAAPLPLATFPAAPSLERRPEPHQACFPGVDQAGGAGRAGARGGGGAKLGAQLCLGVQQRGERRGPAGCGRPPGRARGHGHVSLNT